MVSEFLPPNAEKVKDRFESMLTLLKRIMSKWEKSGQGEGGHNGDDDDGPAFGALEGRSCYALSKIQDFFENNNSYLIYLWHMIARHQLISSSMNMLAGGVGSRNGATGIPTAISARRDEGEDDEEEESSVMSKSYSTISSAKKKKDHGDDLSMSIREHASRIRDFAMAKKEASRQQIEHTTKKEKRKRNDAIQLELGRLRAEKRQLRIQLCSIAPGPQHDNMRNALSVSYAEVEEEIELYSKQLSSEEVDTMQTPQRSNRSPADL
jgi:hypothetical protein